MFRGVSRKLAVQWSRLVCQKGDCVVSAQLLEKNIPLSFPHCFFFFYFVNFLCKGWEEIFLVPSVLH